MVRRSDGFDEMLKVKPLAVKVTLALKGPTLAVSR